MNLNKFEPVSHQGATNSWYTPRWILDKCGHFDLDPCGTSEWPTADEIYETNGLKRPWHGRVWMNPPYGREIGKWTDRLASHGNGLALVFARTDTQWFQSFAPYCSWFLFFHGRVRFVRSDTLQVTTRNPGTPSVLCAVGNQPVPSLSGLLLKPD